MILETLLFPLGDLSATPGVLCALGASDELSQDTSQRAMETAQALLKRHCNGDWGDTDAHDTEANNNALADGERLFSAYSLEDGTRIWIITEADRSRTTILLPDEY